MSKVNAGDTIVSMNRRFVILEGDGYRIAFKDITVDEDGDPIHEIVRVTSFEQLKKMLPGPFKVKRPGV